MENDWSEETIQRSIEYAASMYSWSIDRGSLKMRTDSICLHSEIFYQLKRAESKVRSLFPYHNVTNGFILYSTKGCPIQEFHTEYSDEYNSYFAIFALMEDTNIVTKINNIEKTINIPRGHLFIGSSDLNHAGIKYKGDNILLHWHIDCHWKNRYEWSSLLEF